MRKEVRWERMFPDQLEAAFNDCPAVERMKNPEESPPEDSQWFRQCKLPELS